MHRKFARALIFCDTHYLTSKSILHILDLTIDTYKGYLFITPCHNRLLLFDFKQLPWWRILKSPHRSKSLTINFRLARLIYLFSPSATSRYPHFHTIRQRLIDIRLFFGWLESSGKNCTLKLFRHENQYLMSGIFFGKVAYRNRVNSLALWHCKCLSTSWGKNPVRPSQRSSSSPYLFRNPSVSRHLNYIGTWISAPWL